MTFLLQEVAYSYLDGAPPVLERITAELPSGGVIAILGRSGSGKTTLLSLLGLLGEEDGTLRSGSITYRDPIGDEYPYSHLTVEQRTILRSRRFGFIPQTCYFLPAFTVAQNILMPLYLQNKKGIDSQLPQILKLTDSCDLEDRMQSSPLDISGGQRQRMAILRAIIHNPDVVFGDEPVSNLDESNKQQMLNLLKRWQRGGLHADGPNHRRTLLLVCHDVETAWGLVFDSPDLEREATRSASRLLYLQPSIVRPGSDGCRLFRADEFPGGPEQIRRELFPAPPVLDL